MEYPLDGEKPTKSAYARCTRFVTRKTTSVKPGIYGAAAVSRTNDTVSDREVNQFGAALDPE